MPEDGSEEPQVSSGSTYNGGSNGADNQPLDNTPKTSLSEVEEKILRTWREHPEWSLRKIGRECAVTDKRAGRVIAAAKANGAA